jgi:hypothetical protein
VRSLFRLVVSELYGIGLARLSIMVRIGRMGLVGGQVSLFQPVYSFLWLNGGGVFYSH